MDRGRVFVPVGLACLFFAGCGTSRYAVVQEPTQDFGAFDKTVEVKKFKIRVPHFKHLSSEDQQSIRGVVPIISGRLESALQKRGYTIANEGQRLVIEGAVVASERGNQFVRWFIGFGAGAGKVVADLDYKDTAGNVISQGNAEGTVGGGMLGGTLNDAIDRMVDRIAAFVAQAQYNAPEAPEEESQASPVEGESADESAPGIPTATAAVPTVLVKSTPTGFLRVREKATTASREIGRVLPGDELVLLKEQDSWNRVRLTGGIEGYVLKLYVEKKDP